MLDHLDWELAAGKYREDEDPPEPKPQHIDADRQIVKRNWDRECQESGRLNRRGF